MKRLLSLALLALLLCTGCSIKCAVVINSGDIQTGNVEPVFQREGTAETFSPAGELSIPVAP